jgi:hypothetical protein
MKQSEKNGKVITSTVFPVEREESSTYSMVNWKDPSQPIEVGEIVYHIVADSGKGTVAITYRSEMEYLFEGLTTEKAEVVVDTHTLRPISFQCEFQNRSQALNLEGSYKKDKVEVQYVQDGVKDKWVEKIPYRVLDNYESLMALRALDFENLSMDAFSLVNGLTLSVAEVECTLAERETVTTRIGSFDCFRVCLQVYDPLPFTQYHLYTVSPPHHLIKVIKGPLVFELKEFR